MNQTATLGKIQSKSKSKSTLIVSEKAKKVLIKVGVAAGILLILFGGAWKITKATQGKVLPKVTVAGLKVGGKTPLEAKKVIENYVEELNTQGPVITYDDQSLQPKLEELGASFDINQVINDAYNYGRTGSLKNKITDNAKVVFSNYNINLTPKIDEKKLDEYLGQIAQVVETAPVNASLTLNNGNISVNPSKEGRGLDKGKLKADLNTLINSGKTKGKISLVTSSLKPAISEEGTVSAQNQAQKYMSVAPITVTFEGSSWTANKADIGSWIKFSESGSKLVASVSPASFVDNISSQVEIGMKNREVQDQTNDVLNDGNDGRGVDSNLLTGQIKDVLDAAKAGQTFALVTFGIPRGETIIYPNAQPGRYAGRYIDINLSQQTLYAFEGTKLVNQFLISSGKSGYETPTGEYSVWGKTRSQTMDGPDFYLPNVEWISWFNGEIAVHGTYWHSNFGTPMSHGCINASNANSEWIYNWDEVGTPVYVHY